VTPRISVAKVFVVIGMCSDSLFLSWASVNDGDAKVRRTLNCAILNRPVLRGRILFDSRPSSGSTSMRRLRFILKHTTIEVIVWTLIAIDFVIVLLLVAK
jgi:hypothetical protein